MVVEADRDRAKSRRPQKCKLTMGDCRIYFHISACLITAPASHDSNSLVKLVQCVSADTTVREVLESTRIGVGDGSNIKDTTALLSLLTTGDGSTLWDCTLYPPRNITDWPIDTFSEISGLKSKTLYDAGWFPSGRLYLLAAGVDLDQIMLQSSHEKYEDSQFNKIQAVSSSNNHQATVQLVEQSSLAETLPLPSQVLHAVTTRFDHDDASNETDQAIVAAKLQQRKNRLEIEAKEQARNQKLAERIQRLEQMQSSSNKNKAVSEQVQRMLIKSRATGRKELKQQDRIYFRYVVIDAQDETFVKEEYRYISSQDTAGRIAASFEVPTGKLSELLVRRNSRLSAETTPSIEYKRLPTLMRMYEALSSMVLSEFDQIIVRIYDPQIDSPTPPVTAEDETTAMDVEEFQVEPSPSDDLLKESGPASSLHQNWEPAAGSAYDRLFEQLQSLDKKGPKKTSAAAIKVRQMQMKSKSKGDEKRIKMEERFFLELVTAVDDGKNTQVTVAPVFLGKSDSIERLLTDCASAPSGSGWYHEFLVAGDGLRRITDPSMRLSEAQALGVLQCFDRIVLRFIPNS